MSENNKGKLLKLPRGDIRKERSKALRKLIHDFIEYAERGGADELGGGVELAIFRAQYLAQELVRRSQNRQTRWIIAMTAVIMIMTAAIMAGTICPQWVQSTAQSLLIRASQAIDRWWPRG